VGEDESLVTFVSGDFFLRRVSRQRHIDDDIVSSEVFDDHHPTLSFTLRRGVLNSEAGLEAYQRDKALPSGDLPGIVTLSFVDLTEKLEPPLHPWLEVVKEDLEYGHLHCCTESPTDKRHRDAMAKLATNHGILRPFIKKKHIGRMLGNR
jgi:hypothetical protein